MKPTVYVETSVVSCYTARPSRDIVVLAHQEITRRWWERARERFTFVVSELVVQEVKAGDPQTAKSGLQAIEGLALLEHTPLCDEVAERYLGELPLPEHAALHLATASVHAADYLVSWNVAHVANALIRKNLARTNASRGLSTPIICTPEAMQEETDIVDDPIVKEVRETRKKLFEEAGGTMEGFCEMLRRKEKERKWPTLRRPARGARKKR